MSLNYHIKASVKLVTFDRENQIIPWQGVYFFTNTVLQKSYEHTVVMKNMINTIGKIIHALVKENTPHCHKIRRECGFTQKFTFFYRYRSISLCFLPYCCANIGREVRLMLPNAYQEIYETHTCLNF